MRTDADKPARVLRDGTIKAVIWKNEGDKGPFYSVEFIRSFKDESAGEWKDSRSFSNGQILKVQHLAGKAYDAIAKLRAEDKAEKEGAE